MNKKKFKTWISVAFIGLVLWLVGRKLAGLDWAKVSENLINTPLILILHSIILTGVSYAIFVTYDWLGLRRESSLSSGRQIILPAFVCYAVNLNLGSLVGAVGMRLKLYSDLGIKARAISRVLFLSTGTNWLGYWLLSGVFLISFPSALETLPYVGTLKWQWIGVGLLIILVAAVFLLSVRKSIKLPKLTLTLPARREVYFRIVLATMNWSAVSLVLIGIFSGQFDVPWQLIVGAYLVSAVGGVITHIPAGVGVFEYVFLVMLGPHLAQEQIIGGMLSFRAIYYLAPLVAAVPVYVWLHLRAAPKANEMHLRRRGEAT